MKIMGIISEYNPFHNGHKYHLTESKNLVEPDIVVAVMSSTFMQRGEPALIDKWERAKIAVKAGIDLVVELPFLYACSSAEYFATGGIELLRALGANYISFGAEHPQLKDLKNIALFTCKESAQFSSRLKEYLDQGISFPKARSQTLIDLLNVDQKIVSSPNNILGIEYLKAIYKNNYPLEPVVIARKGADYNEKELKPGFSSATAIRQHLYEDGSLKSLEKYLPRETFFDFCSAIEKGFGPVFLQNMAPVILSRLRTFSVENLKNFPEIETGLENRLSRAGKNATDWDELFSHLETRRFTRTRLQRLLIYIMLGLNKEQRKRAGFPHKPFYIRPLAFNEKGQKLLKQIKNDSTFPLITRPGAQLKNLKHHSQNLLQWEIKATDLWSLFLPCKKQREGGKDFSIPPLRVYD